MNSVKIKQVDPMLISHRLLAQLGELIKTTGYFQYSCMNNKLGVSYSDLIQLKFILPHLVFTKYILDERGNVAGYFVAVTKQQYDNISHDQEDDWHRESHTLQRLLKTLHILSARMDDTDYFLDYFAVRFDLQGMPWKENTSVADVLWQELVRDARINGKKNIVLLVWESHRKAVKYYERQGGIVTERSNLKDTAVNDVLLLMKIPLR